MSLTNTQILPSLADEIIQPAVEGVDKGLEVGNFQSFPKLLVRVLLKGVQVESEGSPEKHRVLGNNGQGAPELAQAKLGNVDPVDGNVSLDVVSTLDDPVEGDRQTALARTGAP